jgi:CheY-like chemotaxis protein/HPt (histidine-containing phosphotransfer) domain-containing protein
VLLAEDNPVNQLVAVGMLKKLGALVDVVSNGHDALRALEKQPYDLVFMDVQMPELDGLEATRKIRKNEQHRRSPHLPIIAMTAHTLAGDKERCLDAGMDDYLTKPIDLGTLSKLLAKWQRVIAESSRSLNPVKASAPKETPETLGPIVFDRAGLLRRLGGDVALAKLLCETFTSGVPGDIAQLRQCLTQEQLERAHRLAHSIKGAAANVGAEALRVAAAELEQASKAGNARAAQALLPQLERCFEETNEVFKRTSF